MRINKLVAQRLGVSRRKADELVQSGRVEINGQMAEIGNSAEDNDVVKVDGKILETAQFVYLLLNKPTGYVSTRNSQGGDKTVYDLLPDKYHALKLVGRLDKDSSGLILLTNDGDYSQELTHPSYQKTKVYKVELDQNLSEEHKQQIESGVNLGDGLSSLQLNGSEKSWTVTMKEGRNRQIRRTFRALNYNVVDLHRTQFGEYTLDSQPLGTFWEVDKH